MMGRGDSGSAQNAGDIPEGEGFFILNVELPSMGLDGGGLRGTFAAALLSTIEEICGCPLGRVFQLFSGTSTGAILAGGLGAGVCAHRLAHLYLERGHEIFGERRRLFNLLPGRRLRRVHDGARYSAEALEILLEDVVGDVRLSEIPFNTMLTTYILASDEQRGPALFRGGPSYFSGPDVKLREAIRASTAAPTFFSPAEMDNPAGGRIVAVDGGLVANNPSYIALLELKKVLPSPPSNRPRPVVILSIGTGRDDDARSAEAARWATPLTWMDPRSELFLIDQLLHAQARLTDYFLQSLFPEVHYVRLDFQLPTGKEGELWKDMSSPISVNPLFAKALRVARNRPNDADEARMAGAFDLFAKLVSRIRPLQI